MKGYQLKILTAIQVLLILALRDGSAQVSNAMSKTTASDSLSLNSIIEEVIKTHPDIKAAEEAIRNADSRIKLAKTGYYPEIDFGADYSNIGPVMQITIPSFGTFELFPQNNYTTALNLRQVIYDFGKTSGNTAVEKENKIIGERMLGQIRQRMAMAAISNFFALSYLQEAAKIKDEELVALQSHLQFVQTMKSTGAATNYQVLSTEVRISAAQSEKVDIEAALEVQRSVLASLTGKDYPNPVVRNEFSLVVREVPKDSLINMALTNREEMRIRKEESVLAGLRYDLIKLMRRPAVSFIASGGFKNGYLP
ncbi:MAG: TolC family protein, partial [Bacteroidales bacterium]